MPPGLFDHLIAASVAIAVPIEGAFARRRVERRIAEGGTGARQREYIKTILWQWLFAAAVTAVWAAAGRPWSALGIARSFGWGFWIAAALAVVVIALLARQARFARTRADFAARVRGLGQSVAFLIPADRAELRTFDLLSVTAGIVEELLCRGFLIWYFAAYVPLWIAVIAAALVFGLAHAYQGARGVLKTGGVGLVFSGLYILSGALWIPMVIHAAVDMLQIRMLFNARAYHVTPMTPEPVQDAAIA